MKRALFDVVGDALRDPENVGVLARSAGIDSTVSAVRGGLLAATVLMGRMPESVSDPVQAKALITALNRVKLDWAGSSMQLVAGRFDESGGALVAALDRDRTADVLVASGFERQEAFGLLAPAAWLLAAAMADHHQGAYRPSTLSGYLQEELRSLLQKEWDPWLDSIIESVRTGPAHEPSAQQLPAHQPEETVPSGSGDAPAARMPTVDPQAAPPVSATSRTGPPMPPGPPGPAVDDWMSPSRAGSARTDVGATVELDEWEQAYARAEDQPDSNPDPIPAPDPDPEPTTASDPVITSDSDLVLTSGSGSDPIAAAASMPGIENRVPEEARGIDAPVALLAGGGVLLVGLLALFLWPADGDDTEAGEAAPDATIAVTVEAVEIEPVTTPTTAAPTSSTTESAGPIEFEVAMDDPFGPSGLTGSARLSFDRQTSQICHRFEAEGIASPFDGHIHVGLSGERGGIVVDFGPLESGRDSCTPVPSEVMEVVLAGGPGHYVELHDAARTKAVRAQIPLEPPVGQTPGVDDRFDPDGGDAVTLAASGRLTLAGDVADQALIDLLVGELSVLDDTEVEVVNDLTLNPDAGRPSGVILLGETAQFEVGSSELTQEGQAVVAELAVLISRRPDWFVTVKGYTDSTGDEIDNLELALRRATSVRNLLVDEGAPSERLGLEGVGAPDPIAENSSSLGRAQNRRVELVVDRR